MEHHDEQWLDENVTTYVAGSIPVNLTPAETRREIPVWLRDEFVAEYGVQTTYRARLVFEWLGY